MNKTSCRVYLTNKAVNGQHCGFGEGQTHDDAVSDALQLAHQRGHQDAQYNKRTQEVEFTAQVRL